MWIQSVLEWFCLEKSYVQLTTNLCAALEGTSGHSEGTGVASQAGQFHPVSLQRMAGYVRENEQPLSVVQPGLPPPHSQPFVLISWTSEFKRTAQLHHKKEMFSLLIFSTVQSILMMTLVLMDLNILSRNLTVSSLIFKNVLQITKLLV